MLESKLKKTRGFVVYFLLCEFDGTNINTIPFFLDMQTKYI